MFRVQDLDQTVREIERMQLQFRLGLDTRLWEGGTLRVRGSTGPRTAPSLSFARLVEYPEPDGMYLDMAYLEHRRAGRDRWRLGMVPSPHLRSELVGDDDVGYTGLSWEADRKRSRSSLMLAELDEVSTAGVHAWMVSAQHAWKLPGATLALGWHSLADSDTVAEGIAHRRLTTFDLNRRTVLADRDGDGFPDSTMTSEYRMLEFYARRDFRIGRSRWAGVFDLLRNTGAPDRDLAMTVEFTNKDLLDGKSEIHLGWFRIEQDATLAPYTGEKYQGTNRNGWFARFTRKVHRDMDVRFWWIDTWAIDPVGAVRPPSITEIRIDLLRRF